MSEAIRSLHGAVQFGIANGKRNVVADLSTLAEMFHLLELHELASSAALAYDDAIRKRAVDGAVRIMETGGAVAEGDDLDALYMDWMTRARAAMAAVDGDEPKET